MTDIDSHITTALTDRSDQMYSDTEADADSLIDTLRDQMHSDTDRCRLRLSRLRHR